MAVAQFLQQLSRLFLARPCLICDRTAAEMLCHACHKQLLDCQLSSANHSQKAQSHYSKREESVPLFAWGEYQGVLKQLLALLKYHNQAELGFWLGCQLGKIWKHSSHPIIVPIPLHQQRLKQRGYNQAALIGKGFCRVTGFPLIEHGLIRIKATQAMHSLGIHERQTNLQKAFQLGNQLPTKGHPVLLIDDIYTTGTTARAAAATLAQAGYPVTGITAIAQAFFTTPLNKKARHFHPCQKPNLHPNR